MIHVAGFKMLCSEWLCNYRAIKYKPPQISVLSAINPFSELFWETVRRMITALGLNFYALRKAKTPFPVELWVEGKLIVFDWNNRAQVLGTVKEIFKDLHYGSAPDGLTVDVGANIGIYSLFASRLGNVIAIEPFDWSWNFLALNSLGNRIIPMKLAIAKESGHRKLFISELSSGNSFYSRGLSSSFVWVETKRLDQLLSELRIQKVDTLKIDAEGSEMEILESAGQYLEQKKIKRIIVASYHYDNETREVVNLLSSSGYRVLIEHSSGDVVFGLALDS